MPRGGGKGGTLLRARFLSCVTNKWNWRRATSVTLQRIASRGNRQDTKRSATAKQMHEATVLTVLALLLALLSQKASLRAF